jgi:hypothetical protein
MYGPSKPLLIPLNLQYTLKSLRFQLILKRWPDLDRLIRLSQFFIPLRSSRVIAHRLRLHDEITSVIQYAVYVRK